MKKLNVSVENMVSSRGNIVPNQFVIKANGYIYFQSYSTVICCINEYNDELTIDSGAYNYSKTTSKYLNMFLHDYFYGVDVKGYMKKHKTNDMYMLIDRRNAIKDMFPQYGD